MQQKSKCILWGERDERINHIVKECNNVPHKDLMITHDSVGKDIHWEFLKKLKFDNRYEVHTISFQTFFVWAFKIVVDTWKFSKLLLYILKDNRPIFMISGSNVQLQQQLEYTLLKPDCHSWWTPKMQSDTSGREDTLEERYAIKLCFKLGKNATETYGMFQIAFRPSCMNRASVFEWHKRFKEGRESLRHDEICGRSKGVNTPELGLGLLCWGFKGVQEEIPSEEANTLEIGSVAFPPGQYTSIQLHHCHRLFDHDGHHDSSSASLQTRPCSLWLLLIP